MATLPAGPLGPGLVPDDMTKAGVSAQVRHHPDGVAVVQTTKAAPLDQWIPERRGRCHVTEL